MNCSKLDIRARLGVAALVGCSGVGSLVACTSKTGGLWGAETNSQSEGGINTVDSGGPSNGDSGPARGDAGLAYFAAPVQASSSADPSAFAVADFNGDKKPDIVYLDLVIAGVHVLLGKGDGTFLPDTRTSLAVDTIVPFDMNGDGKMDLVAVSSPDPNDVHTKAIGVLLGLGDGTFSAKVPVNVVDMNAFAIGDVTGDTKADLVVNDDYGQRSVLTGNGDGTFTAPGGLDAGAPPDASLAYPESLALIDINGDAKLDLLAGRNGGFFVAIGHGDGTFGADVFNAYGGSGAYMVPIDLNGDSKVDVVLSDPRSAGPYVFLGNGDGTFRSAMVGPWPGPSGSPTERDGIAAADVNGDGRLDLISSETVVPQSAGPFDVMLGDGTGKFPSAANVAGSVSIKGIRLADFNGDGKPDVLGIGTFTFASSLVLYINRWP